jgi:hypothetical protein
MSSSVALSVALTLCVHIFMVYVTIQSVAQSIQR